MGTIQDEVVTLTNPIRYPGGATSIPFDEQIKIPFTYFGYDGLLANGMTLPLSYWVQQGGKMAIEEINLSTTLLDNFELHPNPVELGVAMLIEPYARMVFNSVPDFGVAMVGVHSAEVSYGVLKFEEERGQRWVKIFPNTWVNDLGDPNIAPLFNRLTITSLEKANSNIRL